MEPLNIPPTEHTPEVVFDIEKIEKGKHVFEVSGESKPEDVKSFYEPVLGWLDALRNYLKAYEDKAQENHKRKIRLKFRMNYFNSSSAKYLFDIIQKMEEINKYCHNTNVKIIWLYHPGDTDMLESGEEFKSMTRLPFNLSAIHPGEK